MATTDSMYDMLQDNYEGSSVSSQRRKQKKKKDEKVKRKQAGRKPSKPVASNLPPQTKETIPGGLFQGEEVTFYEEEKPKPSSKQHKNQKQSSSTTVTSTKGNKIKASSFEDELKGFWNSTDEETRENALAKATQRLDEHFIFLSQEGETSLDAENEPNYPNSILNPSILEILCKWIPSFQDSVLISFVVSLISSLNPRSIKLFTSSAAPRSMILAIASSKPHIFIASLSNAKSSSDIISWVVSQVSFGSVSISSYLWLEYVVPNCSGFERIASRCGDFISNRPLKHPKESCPPLPIKLVSEIVSRKRPAVQKTLPRNLMKYVTKFSTVETFLPAINDPSLLFQELLSTNISAEEQQKQQLINRAICDFLIISPQVCFDSWVSLHSTMFKQSISLMMHIVSLSVNNISRIGTDNLESLLQKIEAQQQSSEEITQAITLLHRRIEQVNKIHQDQKETESTATSSNSEIGQKDSVHDKNKTKKQGGSSKCKIIAGFAAASLIAVGGIWIHLNCCGNQMCMETFTKLGLPNSLLSNC